MHDQWLVSFYYSSFNSNEWFYDKYVHVYHFESSEYIITKLGFKEVLNKEQIGNSEPFPVTNLPVYLINSEQIGISEQFCDDQKVP